MSIRQFILFICCICLAACGPTEEENIARAKSLLQTGQRDAAITLLDEIIDNNSMNQPAYNMRGIARLENGKILEAIADLDISVALDSNDYRAYYNLGNAYYQIEKFNEAIVDQ